MRSKRLKCKLMGVCVLATLVFGCAPKKTPPPPLSPFSHVSANQFNHIAQGMRTNGVTVVHNPNVLRVILPASVFFYDNYIQIKDSKLPAIHRLARLLKDARGARIRVIGYPSPMLTRAKQKQRAWMMADSLASYLSRYGLSRSRMSVRAGSAQQSVVAPGRYSVNNMNQRVEVVVD